MVNGGYFRPCASTLVTIFHGRALPFGAFRKSYEITARAPTRRARMLGIDGDGGSEDRVATRPCIDDPDT